MACVSLPYPDIRHSQYLLPLVAVDLLALASNASTRAEYKAQLQRQYETSQTFQKQFAIFVAQFAHQQQRSLDQFNTPSLDSIPSGLPSTTGFSSSVPMHPPTLPQVAPWPARLRTSEVAVKIRRRQANLLVPPRPRLSSTLSPNPPHTLLPGPLRRPMPIHRADVPHKTLRKQAVLNCAHGRSVAQEVHSEDSEDDKKLGQSWVVVPNDDWEMVDTWSSL